MPSDVVSSETRDKLVAAGFRVAFRPYREAWRWAARGEAEYSVDLVAGLYVRWGQPRVERPLAELLGGEIPRSPVLEVIDASPQHESPADPYADLTDEPLPGFVRECLDAGFVPDSKLWLRRLAPPFQIFANWVRWTDGTLWFAMPHCNKLAAHGHCQLPRTCTLADFVSAPRPTSKPTSRCVIPQQRSLFE